MAEKRMFSRAVVSSDAFLDMPKDAQCLYFQLNMAADDRGFCDCPRRVMRMIGTTDDAMKLLIAKKFVLIPASNDQVIVIKHWRINNNMRTQRFKETKYTDILNELYYDENNSYSQNPGEGHIPCMAAADMDLLPQGKPVTVNQRLTSGRPMVNQRSTQNRIDKNRVDKSREEENSNIPSTSTERKEEEGESEGERTVLSVSLSPEEKVERIAHWRKMLGYYRNHGYETSGIYAIARAEGLSQEEIDEEAAP
jgi:hypothetical protein